MRCLCARSELVQPTAAPGPASGLFRLGLASPWGHRLPLEGWEPLFIISTRQCYPRCAQFEKVRSLGCLSAITSSIVVKAAVSLSTERSVRQNGLSQNVIRLSLFFEIKLSSIKNRRQDCFSSFFSHDGCDLDLLRL